MTGSFVLPQFVLLWETGLRRATVLRLETPLHYPRRLIHCTNAPSVGWLRLFPRSDDPVGHPYHLLGNVCAVAYAGTRPVAAWRHSGKVRRAMMQAFVSGRVIDSVTRRGVPAIEVTLEELGKTGVSLASTVTDHHGAFRLLPAAALPPGPVIVRAASNGASLASVTLEPESVRGPVVVAVAGHVAQPKTWLTVDTYQNLVANEAAILARVNQVPNGAALFCAHPLRMLADLGVVLSPAAQADLVKHMPPAASGSDLAYESLSRGGARPAYAIGLKSLFGGES